LEDEDVDKDDNEDADDLEGEEENEVLLRASNHIFFLIMYLSYLLSNGSKGGGKVLASHKSKFPFLAIP
jgi:hypothetical protein